jgi:hypothetical protein
MGANVMQILAQNPLNAQEQANRNAMTQAQIPLIGAQTQMQQAQAQQEQQKATLIQQQINDNQALTTAWKQVYGQPQDQFDAKYGPNAPLVDGVKPSAANDLTQIARQNGLSYNGYVGFMQDHMALQSKGLQLDQAQIADLQAHQDQAGAVLEAYDKLPADQQAKQWPQVYAQLQQTGAPVPNLDPDTPATHAQIQQAYGALNYLGTVTKHAQDEAATSASNAATAAAGLKQQQEQRAAAIAQLSGVTDQNSYAKWINNNPQMAREVPPTYSPQAVQQLQLSSVPVEKQPAYQEQLMFQQGINSQAKHQAIDSIASRYPDIQKAGYAAVDTAPDFDAYKAALKSVSEQVAQRNRDLDPTLQAMKVQLSTAEGAAHAQIQNQFAEREKANDKYTQSLSDYQSTQSNAQLLKQLVQQAQAGGPQGAAASSQLRPVLTELINGAQGVKRVAGQQMEEPIGSGLDRLQGIANKIANGGQFSKDILAALPGLADTVAEASRNTHNGITTGLNRVYNQKLPLESGQATMIYAVDPQGNRHAAPAGTPLPPGWKQSN